MILPLSCIPSGCNPSIKGCVGREGGRRKIAKNHPWDISKATLNDSKGLRDINIRTNITTLLTHAK